jgi:hypothetical protein
MANLTSTSNYHPQPYGAAGAFRTVYLPVKATAVIYEGAMIAQINGACCTGTTSGAGKCIGVSQSPVTTGGATDGAVRAIVLTDGIFLFNAGTNAPTDATPYGTTLYMETDNTVGTGGIGGSGEGVAGEFRGIQDDGLIRVYISSGLENGVALNGTALANAATSTATVLGRNTRYQVPTQGQNTVVTLSTTGAVVGDMMTIISVNTAAFTVAVKDGGTGTPVLATLVASKEGFVKAYFDGVNWQLDSLSGT